MVSSNQVSIWAWSLMPHCQFHLIDVSAWLTLKEVIVIHVRLTLPHGVWWIDNPWSVSTIIQPSLSNKIKLYQVNIYWDNQASPWIQITSIESDGQRDSQPCLVIPITTIKPNWSEIGKRVFEYRLNPSIPTEEREGDVRKWFARNL
jgi:hypothetical protein